MLLFEEFGAWLCQFASSCLGFGSAGEVLLQGFVLKAELCSRDFPVCLTSMCGCWEHKPVCAARGGSDWTFGTMSAWEGMLSTVQLPRAGGVSEPRGFGSWGCAGWAQSSFPALCKTPFSFGRFLSGFVLFREPQHRAVTLLVAPRDSPCTICHFLNHSQQMMLTKTLPGQEEERAQRRVSSFYHHFCILLKTPAKTRPVLLQSCIWVFFFLFLFKVQSSGRCWMLRMHYLHWH